MFTKFVKAAIALVVLVGSILPLAASAAPTTAPNDSTLMIRTRYLCPGDRVPDGHFIVRIIGGYNAYCGNASAIGVREPGSRTRMTVCSLHNVNLGEWRIVSQFGGNGALTGTCNRNVEYRIRR